MNNKLKLLITAVCIAAAVVCIVSAGRSYLRVLEIDGQHMKISIVSNAIDEGIRQADAKASAEKKRLEDAKKGGLSANPDEVKKAMEKMINEDPVLQSKRLTAFRAGIPASYGPFFQKMHLPPEQRRRLTDALAQRQADKEDLSAILAAAGQTPDNADSAWQKINQDSLDTFNNAVVSALGEEGPAQLENYEQDMPMWNYVGRIASIAAQSGIPISLEQADRLVALMSRASSTPKPGAEATRMPQTESDWAAIDEQAKTFLSKEQMDMFRSVEPLLVLDQSRGRFDQRFNYEYSQARKDAGFGW